MSQCSERRHTINIRSEYITAFYREGDQLLRGGVVGFRQAGVLLVGDIELTGSPDDLANLGQALVDRFRPGQHVLVTGDLSRGFTFHGPTAPGEHAAETKIADLCCETADYVPLAPLAATPAGEGSGKSDPFADLVDEFRTAAAMMAAADAEAADLLDATINSDEENHEADVRQDADEHARHASGWPCGSSPGPT